MLSHRAAGGIIAIGLVAAAPGAMPPRVPVPTATTPVAERLCPSQNSTPGPDGRVLGHIAYPQASPADLVAAPPGFAVGQPCLIQRAAAVDLTRLLRAAAEVPGVAGRLRGISCYRTIARQRAVFCSQIGRGKRFSTAAQRARFVGPPGFSEHATGYAIDFGIRPSPGCPDVERCIAATVAGKWLLANAPKYGFELSFPEGNAQGVTWEPWHWRWVGTSPTVPGAMQARTLFARARTDFRANPAVTDLPEAWLTVLQQPPSSPLLLKPAGPAAPLPAPPAMIRPPNAPPDGPMAQPK